jgi:hypothetical protein
MARRRCTIYDAAIVHSIMLSTGHSVIEYLRKNPSAGSEQVHAFVESNFDTIIGSTIRDLKGKDNNRGKDAS